MNYVNNAIAQDLEALVSRVNGLLQDLQHLSWQFYSGEDEEGKIRWEDSRDAEEAELQDAVRYILLTLAARILVYSEALRLVEPRRLLASWRSSWSDADLCATHEWNTTEGSGIESRPFNDLRPVVDALLVLTRPESVRPPDPIHRRGRELLEHALRSVAKVCRDRGVSPQRELDVQSVLHSHLEGIFPDYVRTPTIDKPLVSFAPDGGVPSLETAIECKFVASEAELKTAIHGLTEDLSGYAGGTAWRYFFSVVYMTEAFATEGQVRKALGASGHAGSWTTILVTGSGQRLRRSRG